LTPQNFSFGQQQNFFTILLIMKKRNYGEYSEEVRSYWIGRMESLEKLPKRIRPSLKDLAAEENAPPLRTLQEWKRLGNKLPDYNPRWGRPSTLTEDQKMIFDDKVISRLSKHLPCTREWASSWLALHFGWEASKSSVSRLMHKLVFSSHKTASWLGSKEPELEIKQSIAKLEEIRAAINKGYDWDYVVSMDQISFWNRDVVLRSYSPIGA
jgi:transposase